jgi:hydroxyethylthiazole kinase-like uncharacterized protein yjeF
MTDERDWTTDRAVGWIHRATADDDKYSRGVLGVATGSERYPGAAVLGVDAAVRSGAGMVRYVGPDAVAHLILQRRPEMVSGAGRVQAWLIGSGVDAADPGEERLADFQHALTDGVPVVIDAGALALVADGGVAGGVVPDGGGTDGGGTDGVGPLSVLTPHAGELQRLLASMGENVDRASIERDPARWAVAAAASTRAVVLLKGSRTVVATPDGAIIRLPEATPWLSTAGTGDVLAGIIGALVAAAADRIDGHRVLAEVAATGSLVHALAADHASSGGPLAALDVAEAVPRVIVDLLR